MEIYAERFIRGRRQALEAGAGEAAWHAENDTKQGYLVVKYQRMELKEQEVLGGKARMRLPEEWNPMGDRLMAIKYPNPSRAEWIYSDGKGEVTLAMHLEEGTLEEGELEKLAGLLEDGMKRLYPASPVERGEAIGEGRGQILWFSQDIPLLDGLCFHMMFFCERAGGLCMGTFECGSDTKKQWREVLCQLLGTLTDWSPEEGEENPGGRV